MKHPLTLINLALALFVTVLAMGLGMKVLALLQSAVP